MTPGHCLPANAAVRLVSFGSALLGANAADAAATAPTAADVSSC